MWFRFCTADPDEYMRLKDITLRDFETKEVVYPTRYKSQTVFLIKINEPKDLVQISKITQRKVIIEAFFEEQYITLKY